MIKETSGVFQPALTENCQRSPDIFSDEDSPTLKSVIGFHFYEFFKRKNQCLTLFFLCVVSSLFLYVTKVQPPFPFSMGYLFGSSLPCICYSSIPVIPVTRVINFPLTCPFRNSYTVIIVRVNREQELRPHSRRESFNRFPLRAQTATLKFRLRTNLYLLLVSPITRRELAGLTMNVLALG